MTFQPRKNPTTTKKGDVAKNIMLYEHPELVKRFERELDLSSADAAQLFDDIKRYLYLCTVSNVPLAPSNAIDGGWHEFLMYTKDYQEFCHSQFGKFIHHTPNPTIQPHVVRRVSDTNKLALQIFGELSNNWNVRGSDCAPDSDCNGGPGCD